MACSVRHDAYTVPARQTAEPPTQKRTDASKYAKKHGLLARAWDYSSWCSSGTNVNSVGGAALPSALRWIVSTAPPSRMSRAPRAPRPSPEIAILTVSASKALHRPDHSSTLASEGRILHSPCPSNRIQLHQEDSSPCGADASKCPSHSTKPGTSATGVLHAEPINKAAGAQGRRLETVEGVRFSMAAVGAGSVSGEVGGMRGGDAELAISTEPPATAGQGDTPLREPEPAPSVNADGYSEDFDEYTENSLLLADEARLQEVRPLEATGGAGEIPLTARGAHEGEFFDEFDEKEFQLADEAQQEQELEMCCATDADVVSTPSAGPLFQLTDSTLQIDVDALGLAHVRVLPHISARDDHNRASAYSERSEGPLDECDGSENTSIESNHGDDELSHPDGIDDDCVLQLEVRADGKVYVGLRDEEPSANPEGEKAATPLEGENAATQNAATPLEDKTAAALLEGEKASTTLESASAATPLEGEKAATPLECQNAAVALEGENAATALEGENAATALEGASAGTPLEGEKAATPLKGEKAATQLEGEITATALEGEKAATALEGASAATPRKGEKAATALEGENAATALEGENAATALEGEKAATALEGEHAATPLEGANAATALEDENAATALEGEKAATPLEGEKAATALEGEIAATALEGEKPAPLEGASAATPLEGEKAATPLEGEHAATPLEGASAATPLEDENAATALEGENATTALEGENPTTALEGENGATALEGENAATALEGASAATPLEGENAATALEGEHAATPLEGEHAATPLEGASAATPLEDEKAATPLEGEKAATPLEGEIAATALEGEKPAPLEGASAATPLEGEKAATPLEGASAATPLEDENAATALEGENATTALEGENAATALEGEKAATALEGASAATPLEGENAATPLEGANAATALEDEKAATPLEGEKAATALEGEITATALEGEKASTALEGEKAAMPKLTTPLEREKAATPLQGEEAATPGVAAPNTLLRLILHTSGTVEVQLRDDVCLQVAAISPRVPPQKASPSQEVLSPQENGRPAAPPMAHKAASSRVVKNAGRAEAKGGGEEALKRKEKREETREAKRETKGESKGEAKREAKGEAKREAKREVNDSKGIGVKAQAEEQKADGGLKGKDKREVSGEAKAQTPSKCTTVAPTTPAAAVKARSSTTLHDAAKSREHSTPPKQEHPKQAVTSNNAPGTGEREAQKTHPGGETTPPSHQTSRSSLIVMLPGERNGKEKLPRIVPGKESATPRADEPILQARSNTPGGRSVASSAAELAYSASSAELGRVSKASAMTAAQLAQQRVNARAKDRDTSLMAHSQQASMFVSEWLTQHPLVLNYPSHIWLHADCAPLETEEAETADSMATTLRIAAAEEVIRTNQVAIVYLQSGQLDRGLLALKKAEKEIEALSQEERIAFLPVIWSNLAYYYYKKKKFASALQYTQRAAKMEKKAYGEADFASSLRTAAVLSSMRYHSESLHFCRIALETLQQAAARQEGKEDSYQDAYRAHLAVAFHNLATQLARTQMVYEASSAIKVAQELVTQALPTKHRWARAIHATEQQLRDIHLSTSFISHSLRPRAMNDAWASSSDDRPPALNFTRASTPRSLPPLSPVSAENSSMKDMRITTSSPLSGKGMATSSSLPVIGARERTSGQGAS